MWVNKVIYASANFLFARRSSMPCLGVFLVMAFPFVFMPLLHAETAPALTSSAYSEYEIKAGFIYRFISFVSWPEDSLGGTITIGIYGPDSFGNAFSEIQGRVVGGNTVQVVRFGLDAEMEQLKACQILFLGDIPMSRLEAVVHALSGSPVLTVGDSRKFVDKGGMIGFVNLDRRRIGIEINASAAARSGVTIRSMLKRIAGRIIEESQKNSPRANDNNG